LSSIVSLSVIHLIYCGSTHGGDVPDLMFDKERTLHYAVHSPSPIIPSTP